MRFTHWLPVDWLERAAAHPKLVVFFREIRAPEPGPITLPFRQPPRTVTTRVETRKSA